MAYDKVIDSSVLDAGMTATADAIREKTGGVEDIPWEMEKGFSSAIAAITDGSKYAVVSFHQALTSSCSLYYESDGQFVSSSDNHTTLNLKVGSILVYRSSMRSKQGSQPSEPVVEVSGASYRNMPIIYTYTSGTQNVRQCVRYECILFMIENTNVSISIHS